MRTNTKRTAVKKTTHEGGRASQITPLQELTRTVMACMLWEDTFYESGVSVAARIQDLVGKVSGQDAMNVAIKAREDMKLRHVPLLIARAMVKHDKHKPYVAQTLERIIQRPDEITEFLSIYQKS